MPRLEVGDTAPLFTLPDHNEIPVSLKKFQGSPVIVYFYPKDDTPGCTKEACQFNEILTAFAAAKATVLGISPDRAEKHRKFREKYGLEISLLCDPEHAVMEAYGAWGEKIQYGKKSLGVIRSTFLIDPKGRIARAWYNVRADGHAEKVLAELKN